MLAFFSISVGLWGNFRQLWLQDNNFAVTNISNILSIGTFISVIIIGLIGKYVKLDRLKNTLVIVLLVKLVNMFWLYFLNRTGPVELIRLSIIIDIVTEYIIITSIYPLITTIVKTGTIYSKRRLTEYLFRDIGILLVEIKADLAEHPEAVTIYSRKEVPNSLSRLVSETLDEQVRQDKLLRYDIPQLPSIMQDMNRKLNIRTVKWGEDGSESESNAGAAMAAGMVLTLLIYMFVMSYGGMVMQSVMEEKTNRIVEVIVSSVKPFQLMIGKIIGIGLVGVAQLAIWVVLIVVLLAVAGGISGSSPELMGGASGLLATLQGLNLAKMGGLFILNFIGGYLVYASIFAAIGAAINGQEDSQQFMMPIVLLLIFALYAGIYSSDNPDGPLAIWCSMIPFTSPIVMMVRLPFDVPVWETMLSVVLLYAAAFGMIWIAGKIYRVGILMYGKKPSFKEMIRWITYK